jgi:hypothetical protein
MDAPSGPADPRGDEAVALVTAELENHRAP